MVDTFSGLEGWYRLRPAQEEDFSVIRALVREARINPTGLDWRRFTVADNGSGVIGCGQLKPAPGGLTELASLVVLPKYRNKGIAGTIMRHLMDSGPRPLYLTCRSGLGDFYRQYGFRVLARKEMPAYYRRLARLATIFFRFQRRDETLLVMKLG